MVPAVSRELLYAGHLHQARSSKQMRDCRWAAVTWGAASSHYQWPTRWARAVVTTERSTSTPPGKGPGFVKSWGRKKRSSSPQDQHGQLPVIGGVDRKAPTPGDCCPCPGAGSVFQDSDVTNSRSCSCWVKGPEASLPHAVGPLSPAHFTAKNSSPTLLTNSK